MKHEISALNGDFGILIDHVTRDDLGNPDFARTAYDLWTRHGGLLAVRGGDLPDMTPEELVSWSNVFGNVETEYAAAREDKMIAGFPILRIGNITDEAGKQVAQFAIVPQLENDTDVQYNPRTRRPVWHTDSTFRRNPPIGSVFHCKQALPEGGETLFADTRSAYARLDEDAKQKLAGLEAVCSLAHHDKKINLYSPNYPVLTPEQRAANPPNRVPVVLTHPVSGAPALYGLNSSTCAVLPKGEEIADAQLDVCDLEGIEDDSVLILRDLLPYVTGPDFTVQWHWQPGDVVVWDNRCTIHAATGFDYERYTREMWRLTLLDGAPAETAD
ncbi:MAG: TauD/TfdA family dioxygenase [Alphaproteobacteria bacterium]|nr:TauD/TfdA family dioxygenase [Alphaproteobacteria bacterium]